MDRIQFLKNFASQFEDTDSSKITLETEFRDIDEWSSLVHLSVILMLDKEYGVTIEGEDFAMLKTVGDIADYVEKSK
ncbi:uncharacterized protein BN796_01782 [Alistipes sp. CAG:831]|nr:uncharacterized protein BN796_01782 [Alistipes sp. CAG:831]